MLEVLPFFLELVKRQINGKIVRDDIAMTEC